MIKNDKLVLLIGEPFIVSKEKDYYVVESDNSDLAASISEDGITYYLTGCYNSGCDWLEIDTEELKNLKKFCKLITK